jgi:UDP:flavonoid glycosyltransferase YjiC (YdhE family)
MTRKASVLMVTWDGAGNLPPERSLMRTLIARGHIVRALAHDSVRAAIEGDGAECLPLHGVPHYDSQQPMPPEDELPYILEHIWYARGFGSELLEAVDRIRPDLLLVDVSLTHALVAARHAGLPTGVLCHVPYHFVVGPFASLFDSRLSEANAYAAELGLSPFPSHQALIEASPLVLTFSYRSFDPLEECAPNVAHVGPCRSRGEGRERWRRRAAGRPLVLVGLSTSHQHQISLLQRLCDALGALEVDALVTTGPAIAPAAIKASDNTTVLSFVPHEEVLPSASLLITHAGHGTVMAGATYGTPMLCLPMGRDQPLVADRVTQLGLGSVLAPESPVSEIQQAIEAVLADAEVKQQASDFARSVAGHPGVDDAADLVENLLLEQA